MADTLPSPPASRASTPNLSEHVAEKDVLTRRLDTLLETYLELLDNYTKLREALSKDLADGYLSLARAQRTSNMGAGRRYGKDGYDGRMKAIRRVRIGTHDNGENNSLSAGVSSQLGMHHEYHHRFNVYDYQQSPHTSSSSTEAKFDGNDKATEGLAAVGTEDATASAKGEKVTPDPAYRNPISWYGILVPPALRETQGKFVTCTESTIPSLLNTAGLMAGLEREIWSVRATLGLLDQYRTDDDEAARSSSSSFEALTHEFASDKLRLGT